MAKQILFLSTDKRATAAADTFRKVAGLFAGSFQALAKAPTATTDSEVSAATRVIVWDESLKARFPNAEVWADADLEPRIAQLLAEVMGGGAAFVPPPPKPPKPKSLGTVKIGREIAGRRGKGVTVVWEVPLNEDGLKELCTKLKNRCGSGGTAKAGRIEIQGDHRDTVQAELEVMGYKVKRSGG